MTHRGYLDATDVEVASGVAYAKAGRTGEDGFPPTDISHEHFRSLFNRMNTQRSKGSSPYDAKQFVLNADVKQWTRSDQLRRRAISAALSHVLGIRSGYSRKRSHGGEPTRKVHAENNVGQFEFAL